MDAPRSCQTGNHVGRILKNVHEYSFITSLQLYLEYVVYLVFDLLYAFSQWNCVHITHAHRHLAQLLVFFSSGKLVKILRVKFSDLFARSAEARAVTYR